MQLARPVRVVGRPGVPLARRAGRRGLRRWFGSPPGRRVPANTISGGLPAVMVSPSTRNRRPYEDEEPTFVTAAPSWSPGDRVVVTPDLNYRVVEVREGVLVVERE